MELQIGNWLVLKLAKIAKLDNLSTFSISRL